MSAQPYHLLLITHQHRSRKCSGVHGRNTTRQDLRQAEREFVRFCVGEYSWVEERPCQEAKLIRQLVAPGEGTRTTIAEAGWLVLFCEVEAGIYQEVGFILIHMRVASQDDTVGE